MQKLSEIKLVDATAKDFARAINYSMKKSKTAANAISGQLQMYGPMNEKHVLKMYPADTFMKDGKINPVKRIDFAAELQNTFKRQKPLRDYNMLDFANAIIKKFSKV